MRLRPSLLVLPVLAVALLASGCFESRTAGTVSTPITIGVGTAEKEVNPGGHDEHPGGDGLDERDDERDDHRQHGGDEHGHDHRRLAELSAVRQGQVRQHLRRLPHARRRRHQGRRRPEPGPTEARRRRGSSIRSANGGAVMPPKLLTGQDAKDVAAYVAAVAGK